MHRIVATLRRAATLLLVPASLLAQVGTPARPPARPAPRQGLASSSVSSRSALPPSGISAASTGSPNEEVRVIVQLRSQPSCLTQPPHTARIAQGFASAIAAEHQAFAGDLARIEGTPPPPRRGNSTITLQAAHSSLLAEFRSVYNGYAVQTRRWVTDELKKLSYVKAVYPDLPVHALDGVSDHVIGADSVWVTLGATGRGVKIGFLDTGIDYTHPDLGGGFGPGFKVAGGWDFFNNDPDPMDDDGHGTHVAGIAAANGPSLKGVAPEATLYAYKVLNNEGSGDAVYVLQALEQAVAVDHVQVVNISLGADGGTPDDPVSEAVDNAVASGVICVASAGNDQTYMSIVSPGCAAGAITVAASYDDDSGPVPIWSKGPAAKTFAIKPDLLAPGSQIFSTYLQGRYFTMGGSSMAAPHVAGGAALLLQLHPDWTPEMVKGALLATAKDLGAELWAQGKGRVDVFKAARARAFASPGTVSFGLDPMTSLTWQKTDTITVWNVSDHAKIFLLTRQGNLPPGVNLSLSAGSLSLPPHTTQAFTATVQVDNQVAPVPQTEVHAVLGTVTATSSEDTLRLPFAFSMGSFLDLTVYKWPNYDVDLYCTRADGYQLHASSAKDNGSFGSYYWPRRFIQPGLYELVGIYRGGYPDKNVWVVHDSIQISGVCSGYMGIEEGMFNGHTVGFLPVDRQGVAFGFSDPMWGNTRIFSKRTGAAYGNPLRYAGNPMQEVGMSDLLNPLTGDYVFDTYYATNPNQHTVYTFAQEVSPVDSDHVLSLQTSPLQLRTIDYRFPETPASLAICQATAFSQQKEWDGNYSPNLTPPYHQVWYAMGQPVQTFPYHGFLQNFQEIYDEHSFSGPPSQGPNTPLLCLPNRYAGSDGLLRSTVLFSDRPVLITKTNHLTYGLGPKHWFGRTDNTATQLHVKTNTPWGQLFEPLSQAAPFLPLFLNQLQDAQPASLPFTLADGQGKLLASGTAIGSLQRGLSPDSLADCSVAVPVPSAGKYTLRWVDSSSYVLSYKGAATVALTMDTRLADKNPPAMAFFTITADSDYTDVILPGQAGKVEFQLSDDVQLATVALSYHTESDSTWRSLSLLSDSATYFRAAVPPALPNEFIALRVLATDASGNTLDYRAEPAFRFGPNRPPKVTASTDTLAHEDSLYHPRIPASDPDSDPLSWAILAGPRWLTVDSLRGGISGRPGSADLADTSVTVQVSDPSGATASASWRIHVRHTNHASSQVKLLAPAKGDSLVLFNPSRPVSFRWSRAQDPDPADSVRYSFHMTSVGLDTTILGIKDTILSLNVMVRLLPGSNYRWSISSTDGKLVTPSDTVSFGTSSVILALDRIQSALPTSFALSQNFPNPFNPLTVIRYALPQRCHVTLTVFNTLGQQVAVLVNGDIDAGYHDVQVNGGNLASGVYFYRLHAREYVQTRSLVVLK